MLHHVPISTDSLSAIRSATKEDSTLQTLVETILQGWPNDKTKTSSNIRSYCSFQDELSYQDGIVFRGERVVIPEVLRRDITSQCTLLILEWKGAYEEAESASTGPA